MRKFNGNAYDSDSNLSLEFLKLQFKICYFRTEANLSSLIEFLTRFDILTISGVPTYSKKFKIRTSRKDQDFKSTMKW